MSDTTKQPLEGYTVKVDWAGTEDISKAIVLRGDGTVVMTYRFWAGSEIAAREAAQAALVEDSFSGPLEWRG